MNIAKQRQQLLVVFGGTVAWGSFAYGLACILPVATALIIGLLAIPVPYMDEWSWADFIYRLHVGGLTFGDLWRQHNEHRMLIPNVIALGLASLGGWSQLRETLFSLLLVVITQIGVFVLLRRIIAPQKLPFVFLAASLMLYSLAQMANWDWGFQIGWFLCNACAVWTVLFLGTAGQSWLALIAAALLATVGSFSSSFGLMIWPAGIATLLLTERRRPAQIAVWLVVAVAAFAVYYHGYSRSTIYPDPWLVFHHPFTVARFIGAYFGSVLAGWIGFAAAVAVGWGGLVILAALVWSVVANYVRDRQRASRANSFIGLAAYAVCASVMTASTRVDFGQTPAEASRFASIAIYCWVTICALWIAFGSPYAARFLPAKFARLVPLVFVGLGLLYAGADRAGLKLGKSVAAQVRTTYSALLIGHGPELTILYPDEPQIEGWIKELQSVKDGPYYK